MRFATLRSISIGLVACALFSVPSLAQASGGGTTYKYTGTLVGQVTCGADEATPAAHIAVVAGGVQAVTDATGRFMLSNVPTGTPLTVDAIADPQSSLMVARADIVVQPGQTLDVGSLDVVACGQPIAPPSDQQDGVLPNG
jgi:hypothetical protein